MDLLKTLVLFHAVVSVFAGGKYFKSGYEKRELYTENKGNKFFVKPYEKKHCSPGDKDGRMESSTKTYDPWLASHLTNKFKEIPNGNDIRSATKMNDRTMKHLAKNPYSTLYRHSIPANLEMRSDDSTAENAKTRVKRTNDHIEESKEHDDNIQANIEKVFNSRSIDSSKLTDNDLIDDTLLNDPDLQENIRNVFGFEPSERLLAQNVQNKGHNKKNNLNELTDIEDMDETIEDFDSSTRQTNLNDMILELFGSEQLDDEPDTTTEYRFGGIETILDKHKNMVPTHNHHSTPTNKGTSFSGDENHSSSTKNPDADPAKAAPSSTGDLTSKGVLYLMISLFMILYIFSYKIVCFYF